MLVIFLIALSLAMDACAVSISSGLAVKNLNIRHALLLGVYFGGFQFLMPLIGWLLGSTVSDHVTRLGPWISFVLLAAIGGKMVWEAARSDGGDSCPLQDLTHSRLLVLAVATSIDAFAVGVSFAFMDVSIWAACGVIGLVAFILSALGGLVGGRLGYRFRKRAELVGGLVLVAIGARILLENLF